MDVNLLTGTGSGGTAEGDTLTDVENLIGSIFDDDLTGDDEDNLLHGGIGIDVLVGNGGNDTLDGGIGNDWLVGGNDADTLVGGEGLDFASYGAASSLVTIDLAYGIGLGAEAENDTLSGIENIAGSAHGDVLFGDAGSNILIGQAGDDTLFGGVGADLLIGLADDDTYFVDNALDVVVEAGSQGIDTVLTSVSYALTAGADVEVFRTTDDNGTTAIDLTGNASGNEITGNNASNVLDGGGGNDQLIGRDGDDTYLVDSATDTITENGGQGIDTVRTNVSYVLTAGADVELLATSDDNGTAAIDLTGNANGNIVRGNNGNNVINGGDGDDDLTGLGGQDLFLFDTPLDAAVNLDVITDFNVADDTILLENTVFGAFAAGGLAAERFVIGTAALDANDNIIYDAVTGALYYDSDGNGAARRGPVRGAERGTGADQPRLPRRLDPVIPPRRGSFRSRRAGIRCRTVRRI